MILLDTNVVSGLMQKTRHEGLIEWVNAVYEPMWITSVTLFELRYGIALLPSGKKKAALVEELNAILKECFEDCILGFDVESAQIAARIHAERKKKGQNVEMRDAMIAGIALAHRATLATRNVKDFRDTGIKLVNPWE